MINFRPIFNVSTLSIKWLAQVYAWLAAALLTSIACVGIAHATSSVSLSLEEQQMAGSLSAKQIWPQPRSNDQNAGAHPLGVQTLSIELAERKKGENQRRAKVYQFSYLSQQSRLVLIDLRKGSIENTQPINSVHLPLNNAEISTARQLVEQNEVIMQTLNLSLVRRIMPEIHSLDGIEVKASVFEPVNQLHPCAAQRCALISLFDHTRTVFAVEPVVNLQLQSVTILQQNL